MKDYLNKYTWYGFKELMLQPNKKIKNFDLSKYKLYVGSNRMGPEGCNLLSRAQWAALQCLDLGNFI